MEYFCFKEMLAGRLTHALQRHETPRRAVFVNPDTECGFCVLQSSIGYTYISTKLNIDGNNLAALHFSLPHVFSNSFPCEERNLPIWDATYMYL